MHRVDVHSAKADDEPPPTPRSSAGYIAWAATTEKPADTAAPALREALSHWFGSAAGA